MYSFIHVGRVTPTKSFNIGNDTQEYIEHDQI